MKAVRYTRRMPATARAVPEPADLGAVLEFMRRLWAVEHGLQRTSKRMARELGMTGPQRLALRLVARFPGISPKELAGLLRLHPSTVTGVLVRLERRTLIERRPHKSDRRRVHLFVRRGGRRLNRRSRGTVEEAVKTLLTSVGKSQLAVANDVLKRLADVLLRNASLPA
jgi:DNA-binding MarR family transcriptional regulator